MHYNKLVHSGFLKKAAKQIDKARTAMRAEFFLANPYREGEFFFSANRNDRKLDFDGLYEDLDLKRRIEEDVDLEDADDLCVINAPEFIIIGTFSRKALFSAIRDNYRSEGLIPYYITKRKIHNRFMHFCLSWDIMPFDPFSEN